MQNALALVEDVSSVNDRLLVLQEEITYHHQSYEDGIRASVSSACAAGERLETAKALIREVDGHGHWEKWVEENIGFGIRTAQRYMRVYRERARITGAQTIDDALDLLAEPKEPKTQHEEPQATAPSLLPDEPISVLTEPFELEVLPAPEQLPLPDSPLYVMPMVADWLTVLRTMPPDQRARSRDALIQLRDEINMILAAEPAAAVSVDGQ